MTLTDIWDRIDNANLLTDTAQRVAAFEDIIRELKRLASAGQAGAWYPLGYVYYCHPLRAHVQSVETDEMVSAFSNAIAAGHDRSMASLYMAFHMFDRRNWAAFQSYMKMIDQRHLDETVAIQFLELRACAAIQTLGMENAAPGIEELNKFIRSLETPAIAPILLLNTIQKALTSAKVGNPVKEMLRLLDGTYPILGSDGFSRLPQASRQPGET